MPSLAMKHTHSHDESCGGRLVTVDGKTLPLRGASLSADAKGGIARITLEQRFANTYAEPLQVTYQLPLPADGAVSGFAFRIGDQRIVGEVDKKHRARERFEEAILSGRTAAILDQERSSLFTQEIGNIPPGAEVTAEISIDQKLSFLPEGAWEWRFPTVVAPRYLGAPGSVPDADKIFVDVASGELPAKLSFSLTIRDGMPEGGKPESPSHTVRAVPNGGRFDVSLGDEKGAALDRDVVVRWPVAAAKVGLSLDTSRGSKEAALSKDAFGLLTIVPPSPKVKAKALPRDLIFLLDTSGSMGGEPLEQARRVCMALVDTLTDDDRLEMIEFSNSPRAWKSKPVDATEKNRKDAKAWLEKLVASGGTEMRSGILAALKSLRTGAQRQVVLLTDGLIGSEVDVIRAIREQLPNGARVHTVGIGSGVNRSLTGPAARAGRGVELVIGLGEDAERAASRIVARTTAPLVTEVEITGSAVVQVTPAHLPDLFAASPALVSLRLKPEGGEVVVRGRTADGPYEQRLEVRPAGFDEGSPAVRALFGREAVEDLELALATTFGGERQGLDEKIEALGLEFQISTRLTSWVAVTKEATVDPNAPTRKQTVPHELPFGMSAEGVGLRPAMAAPQLQGTAVGGMVPMAEKARMSRSAAMPPTAMAPPPPAPSSPPMPAPKGGAGGPPADAKQKKSAAPGFFDRAREAFGLKKDEAAPAKEASRPASPAPMEPADGFASYEEAGDADEEVTGTRGLVASEGSATYETIRLTGKVRLQKDGELVLELEIPRELAWGVPLTVEVTWADGRTSTLTVEPARTTREATLGAGTTARLTLKLPPTEAASRAVRLTFLARDRAWDVAL